MNAHSVILSIPGSVAGLLTISLEATVVAGLIVVVRRLVGRRLAPRWRYALWWIFLARLALPWAPQSGLSLFNLYDISGALRGESSSAAGGNASGFAFVDGERSLLRVGGNGEDLALGEGAGSAIGVVKRSGPAGDGASLSSGADRLEHVLTAAAGWLPLIWFLGALLLASRMVGESWRFSRRILRRRPLTDSGVLELLEKCKQSMGVNGRLEVVESPRVGSPALFGVIRPRLLLPEGLADSLSAEQLRSVFCHELAHLKRRDVAVNWLMAVFQAIHWFNPAVWAAFSRMRADRELACDALALSFLDGEGARAYGETLVDLMERSGGKPRPAMVAAWVGVVERSTRLKERVGWIADGGGKPYGRGAVLGVMLSLALGAVTLTGARTAQLDQGRVVRVSKVDGLARAVVAEGSGSVRDGKVEVAESHPAAVAGGRAPSANSKTTDAPPPPRWRERFDTVYHLDKDQVLKRVAPPFIPERAIYYRVEFPSQVMVGEPVPISFYFPWQDGALSSPGSLVACVGEKPPPQATLNDVLHSFLDLGRQEVDDPGNLRKMEVGGDWIHREGASSEELLHALESILHNELGRDIVFEPHRVEREAIVVTGSYSFTREPNAYTSDTVHIYSDHLDPEGAGGGKGTVAVFLHWIGNWTGIPVVNETNSSHMVLVWQNDKSSNATALREDPQRVDLLLENLHRQTGLTYRREQQKVQVWRIVEKKRSSTAALF